MRTERYKPVYPARTISGSECFVICFNCNEKTSSVTAFVDSYTPGVFYCERCAFTYLHVKTREALVARDFEELQARKRLREGPWKL